MTSPEQLDTTTLVELAAEEAASFKLPQDWMDARRQREAYAIDSPGARDRDDAFVLSTNGEGHILHVSIADTGSYIPESLPAVTELASRRLSTIYRTRQALTPMIPRTLSERIFSFNPDRPRPGLTAHIPIDFEGNIYAPTLSKEAIDPLVFAYSAVQKEIESGEHGEQFARLAQVAQKQLDQRRPDHAGEMYLEDTRDRQTAAPDTILGKFIVQECMILCNTVIAEYMQAQDIPGLYRGSTKVRGLVRYLLEPTPHRDLNAASYTHVTSPIRRFGDFVNTANLAAHVEGEPYPYDKKALATIANRLNGVKEPSQFFIEDAPDRQWQGEDAELFSKLSLGKASVQDLAHIFFAPVKIKKELRSRQELRQHAVDYVINNPRVASKVIPEAIDMEWVTRDIPLNASGKPISGSYMLKTVSGEYVIGVSRKKNATPTALTIEVLAKAAGIELNPVELTQQFKVDARLNAALKDGDKYLRTMHSKVDIGYEATFTGEGSACVASASVVIDGKRRLRQGRGVNRKEALQNAATQLIQDLQLVEYEPATPEKSRPRKK